MSEPLCIGGAILVQVTVFVSILDFRNGGGVRYAVAAGLLALGHFAGLVHINAGSHPQQGNCPSEGHMAAHCESLLPANLVMSERRSAHIVSRLTQPAQDFSSLASEAEPGLTTGGDRKWPLGFCEAGGFPVNCPPADGARSFAQVTRVGTPARALLVLGIGSECAAQLQFCARFP